MADSTITDNHTRVDGRNVGRTHVGVVGGGVIVD